MSNIDNDSIEVKMPFVLYPFLFIFVLICINAY